MFPKWISARTAAPATGTKAFCGKWIAGPARFVPRAPHLWHKGRKTGQKQASKENHSSEFGGILAAGLRVGIDLVAIQDVAASIAEFGERYLARVFTDTEIAYCRSSPEGVAAARFAARFAAKEATIKTLRPTYHWSAWNQIEICRDPSGWCDLKLRGEAAELARQSGLTQFALSMTHDSQYASAVVVAQGATHGDA
jgi:holo-[acyl-carrier protein] synthase